jgi:hypothetical protein
MQMVLSERFNVVTSCTIVRMSELQVDTPYPILYAQTVDTKYGPTVILTLQDSAAGMIKVFLPRRYGMMFTQAHMTAINEKSVTLDLKYLGTCPNSKDFMLNIARCETRHLHKTKHHTMFNMKPLELGQVPKYFRASVTLFSLMAVMSAGETSCHNDVVGRF